MRYNLLVEGETDAAYLNLAIKLVKDGYGIDLSEGGQLSIFPPGPGRDGGVFKLVDDATLLLNMVKRECDPKFEKALTLMVLLDSDKEGQQSYETLVKEGFPSNNVLLLHANFPLECNINKRKKELNDLNSHDWDKNCWIEELLSSEVQSDFIRLPIHEVRTLLPQPTSSTVSVCD